MMQAALEFGTIAGASRRRPAAPDSLGEAGAAGMVPVLRRPVSGVIGRTCAGDGTDTAVARADLDALLASHNRCGGRARGRSGGAEGRRLRRRRQDRGPLIINR